MVQLASEYNKVTANMQKIYRGSKQRRDFKARLKVTAHSMPKRQTKQNLNMKTILHFQKAIKKLGLTTESIFRICDKQGLGQITTKQFTKVLAQMNTGLTKNKIAR